MSVASTTTPISPRSWPKRATHRTGAPPSSRESVHRHPGRRGPRDDEYRHLEPVLARYAGLDEDDPARPALREQLARGYYPVVAHLALRYRDRGEPVEDLEQVGALGLLNAIDRFTPDHGTQFLAYAIPTIAGEIRRHFRDRTWSVHVPRRAKDLYSHLRQAQDVLGNRLQRAPRVSELATHLDVSRDEVIDALAAQQSYKADSLDRPIGDSEIGLGDLLGGVDTRIGVIEARESVRPIIENLTERERVILALRFFDNMTQTQIADRIGLSQMHVSRLLAQTLARLRRDLFTDADDPPLPAPVARRSATTGQTPESGRGARENAPQRR